MDEEVKRRVSVREKVLRWLGIVDRMSAERLLEDYTSEIEGIEAGLAFAGWTEEKSVQCEVIGAQINESGTHRCRLVKELFEQ